MVVDPTKGLVVEMRRVRAFEEDIEREGMPASKLVTLDEDMWIGGVTISPNGQRIVFAVVERGRDENSGQLLKLSRSSSLRIALDERGRSLTTTGFVHQIDTWELDGSIKTVAILIGGADGHSDSLRQSSDEIWSLSSLTLQHELAQLVFLEALYRAYTIKRGEPYHR